MKTSESISNLTKALLKAQAQMGAAVKGSKNPFFKSSYADLPTVMEVVKGPLNDAGLIVLQPASNRDGKNFIETTIVHADSGEFITSETEVVVSQAKTGDAQAFGAAQTYARRFGLQSMLFIPAEDDDGNTAANRTVSKANTQTKSAPVTSNVAPQSVATTTSTLSTPATTDELLRDETPMGANNPEVKLEPMKKSSFRKPKVTAAEVATPSSEEGWN